MTLNLDAHRCSLDAEASRMVFAPRALGLYKLVDEPAEAELLTRLLDKKTGERGPEGLHPLLASALRDPPLPHGSRFGTRFEPSLWYGSLALTTLLHEVAYYRLLFLRQSAAALGALESEHLLLRARIQTDDGQDLRGPAFEGVRAGLLSKTSYASCQSLGKALREAGTAAFLFPSARDPAAGANLGVFSPDAFNQKGLRALPQSWSCRTTHDRVLFCPLDEPKEVRCIEAAVLEVAGEFPVVT